MLSHRVSILFCTSSRPFFLLFLGMLSFLQRMQVRQYLMEGRRQGLTSQAVINTSEEAVWNLMSACSNTGAPKACLPNPPPPLEARQAPVPLHCHPCVCTSPSAWIHRHDLFVHDQCDMSQFTVLSDLTPHILVQSLNSCPAWTHRIVKRCC